MPKAVRRRIGFVTQDDLMWQTLTVEATLTYASELRLPESLPRDQKAARVEHIICLLGLEKCRGTQIGGALQRGVSGGERKRVSIALELLTDPALLLLDEPTSGLDSTIAAKLIATLRGLSMAGRAIVASIHQPSTRVFRSFDVVMLLAEGRVLYYGPSDDVGAHFGALGHALPSSMNPAEWLLDLASAEPGVGGEAARSALLDAYAAAHPEPPPTRGEDERHVYGRKPPGALMRLLTRHKADINAPPPPLAGQAKWATSFAKQVAVLTRRNIAARAEGVLDTWRVGQVIAVAILSGLLWLHVGKHWHDEKGIGDIAGLIFFALLFNVFLSLFGALFAFPNERAITVKERRGGWFRLASYYIARTLADLPLELVVPTGFIIILFWMASLRAAAFVPILLIVLLSVLISSSLGLLLSAVTMDLKRSQALASVLTLVIMLTGGFYIDKCVQVVLLAFVPRCSTPPMAQRAWMAGVAEVGLVHQAWLQRLPQAAVSRRQNVPVRRGRRRRGVPRARRGAPGHRGLAAGHLGQRGHLAGAAGCAARCNLLCASLAPALAADTRPRSKHL